MVHPVLPYRRACGRNKLAGEEYASQWLVMPHMPVCNL